MRKELRNEDLVETRAPTARNVHATRTRCLDHARNADLRVAASWPSKTPPLLDQAGKPLVSPVTTPFQFIATRRDVRLNPARNASSCHHGAASFPLVTTAPAGSSGPALSA